MLRPALAEERSLRAWDPVDQNVLQTIQQCLKDGMDAVLRSNPGPSCVPYKKGDAEKLEYPSDIDAVCNHPSSDTRRLPPDFIKRLALDQSHFIDPKGIRLFGAIFCETLDLVGLDLTYSLVLDQSIFKDGIEARNFHTKGDFSIDKSLIFGELRFTRSRVDGTVWASDGFIQKVGIFDTEISGSLLFRRSVLYESANLNGVNVVDELSIRQSAVSYFILQFSKVGGVLDIGESQARCAYQVRKSEIGTLEAADAGFGILKRTDGSDAVESHEWLRGNDDPWKNTLDREDVRELPHNTTSESPDCNFWDDPQTPISFQFRTSALLVSDTTVNSSVCLRQFHWLKSSDPKNQKPAISYLTLRNVIVKATSFIDLVPGPEFDRSAIDAQFRAIELDTHALHFNWTDINRIKDVKMFVSGLHFQQVYSGNIECNYYIPESETEAATKPGEDRRPRTKPQLDFSDPQLVFTLPNVNDVMAWLDDNLANTTQPFAAFVDAYQRAGNDADAKKFRISRATKELCDRIRRLTFVPGLSALFCSDVLKKNEEPAAIVADSAGRGIAFIGLSAAKTASDLAGHGIAFIGLSAATTVSDSAGRGIAFIGLSATQTSIDVVSFVTDVFSVVLGLILWGLADHGYRPEKTIWAVIVVISIFLSIFWVWFRVIAFKPINSSVIKPLGVLFIFDRLIPVFEIREEHYKIDAFYKLALGTGRARDVGSGRLDATKADRESLHFIRWNIPVIEADERDKRRIRASLDGLRIIGAALVIFLAAAVKALVTQ